jgi:serine O-acetyltransferase
MFNRLKSDIECIMERDPAAKSRLEILTCYPGIHALIFHRLAHLLWGKRFFWLARFISNFSRWLTGIEIHPAALIGERVFFDHAMGVVIGETAVVGDGCTIYQGVTLGGTSLYKNTKRHPTLGRDVVVGAGAKVLGGFEVGDGAKIGSNAVVTKPVPKGATAVGNPARIIEQTADAKREEVASKMGFSAYGVTQNDDPISQALRGLIDHAQSQEEQLALLWQRIHELSQHSSTHQPEAAHPTKLFERDKLNKLIE